MKKAESFRKQLPTSRMSLADAIGVSTAQDSAGNESINIQAEAANDDRQEHKRWFIAIVMHNTEKSCCKKLTDLFSADGRMTLDFETYVPSQKEVHVWRNGRRKKIDRILIPTYIFIKCTETVRKTIKSEADFIKSFMKDRAGLPDEFGIHPFAFIPEQQMVSLQRMVGDAETPVTIDTRHLHVGAKVRVKGGRLTGFEGNILREPSGKTSIFISIDFLGCAKAEIPVEMLEIIT